MLDALVLGYNNHLESSEGTWKKGFWRMKNRFFNAWATLQRPPSSPVRKLNHNIKKWGLALGTMQYTQWPTCEGTHSKILLHHYHASHFNVLRTLHPLGMTSSVAITLMLLCHRYLMVRQRINHLESSEGTWKKSFVTLKLGKMLITPAVSHK